MKKFLQKKKRKGRGGLPDGVGNSVYGHPQNDSRVLSIIEDLDNGHEFYITIVDSFPFAGRNYIAASVYEPEAEDDPEFVLMRTDIGEDGHRYFQSIRNSRELDAVFDLFFNRYVENLRHR